tara:strand:- start:39617 stop:40036 length:420 start_codon:yes stop_codon:yes gene_type:complete
MKLLISIISIIGLILLSIYGLTQHDEYYPTIQDLKNNPEKYHNWLIEESGTVKNIQNGEFILVLGNEEILVKNTNIRQPKQGSISLIGIFNKEGFIELQKIQYFDYNHYKYWISIIGLFIFLFIFLKEWKLTKRGFENA